MDDTLKDGKQKSEQESEQDGRDQKIARFWSEFRKALVADGLASKHGDWYVRKAQQFVDKTRNVKLRDKTAEDVRAYLARIVTRWNLEEWQYIQVVDALRVLFVRMVKPAWANEFPWDKWKEPHLNFPAVLVSGVTSRHATFSFLLRG